MISSRWPLPIGISASIARMPVCSGCLTGWRCDDASARRSRSCGTCVVSIGALAVDRLAERIDDAAEQRFADRNRGDAAGAPHLSPSLISASGPMITTPTLSSSRLSATPCSPFGNSTSSDDCARRAVRRRARCCADLDDRPDLVFLHARSLKFSICCLRIPAISSALIIVNLSSLVLRKENRASSSRRPAMRAVDRGGRPSSAAGRR